MFRDQQTAKITVHGQEVILQRRRCGCKKCSRIFYASIKSRQSVCSTECFEFHFKVESRKGVKLPPVVVDEE